MSPRERNSSYGDEDISPDGEAQLRAPDPARARDARTRARSTHDEADAPSAEESYIPARRHASSSMFQIGCTWLALFALALIAALVGGVWWTIQRVQEGRWAKTLPTNFQEISLLPGAAVQAVDPETTLRLYFVSSEGTLAPVERRLRVPASAVERTHVVAHELTRPPEDAQLSSPLPPGAELRGVFINKGIALVDLSREFQQPKNPTPQGERLAVYGIVNSLMLNNTDLQGVRLLIEGRQINSAWGWLDLSSPLGADLSIIKQ